MKYNYCLQCAAPLTAGTTTDYICANGHPFWNNPKSAVGVALVKDGMVLFARRAGEPFMGKYDLPGGFVNFGENAWEAATRELKEEAGIDIRNLRMIDSTHQLYEENVSVCDVVFATDVWDGEPVANDDVAGFVWKPVSFISSDEFAWDYPNVAEKLQQHFKLS
jgi:ADP-ribose pyrophosphatase YjhB (NUDIX family)